MWPVCVCPSASICPSKQSWQANLIWPGKGQPHSNCLSLTLCTGAPLLFLFLHLSSYPLLLSSPYFPSFSVITLSLSYLYSFTFLPPILFKLFSSFPCFSWQFASLFFSLLMYHLFSPVSPLFCLTGMINTHTYRLLQGHPGVSHYHDHLLNIVDS